MTAGRFANAPFIAHLREQAVLLLAFCLVAAIVTSLAGCSSGSDIPPLPQADQVDGPYRLGAGDKLHIITFGEEQLTGSFDVNDSGGVAMPLIGIIPAQGLTSGELASRIAQKLREQNLLADPNITVSVTKYRPIYILGEVAKPGEYPFEPGMTLLSAVSVAGGFTYRGIQSYASVVRVTGNDAVESKITRQTLIKPGDVITIFERYF
jgi:polysaccharide export outer membrane protein